MDHLNNLITVGTSIIVLLVGTIVVLLTKLKEIKDLRAELQGPTIVGVVGCQVPKILTPYKDFVDYKKARRCRDDIVVLHCRLLSYALKKCDFVCSDVYKSDEKVHKPNDAFWNALVVKETN